MNASSPSVPVTPLIMTTEPLEPDLALADSGACNTPGASSASSTGMFVPLYRRVGAVAFDLEFERNARWRARCR